MKKLNPLVYLFTMGHFASDWSQGAIPALLPYFISACNLNYQDAASLIFANILLSSITQPIFGYYSDKISKPWFIPAGPILCGLSLTIIAFSTSYWVIFFCSMMCGLGSAVFHPESALMVNKISGKLKGQALGSFSVGGNAGFAAGPMVAGFCAYAFDIRGLVIFGIVNTILAGILYYKMPLILKQAAEAEVADVKAHHGAAKTNDWPSFGKLSVVILARSLGFTLCNTFIPIYWISVLNSTPAKGSLALSLLFSMGVVITFIGGIMADRLGFIRVMACLPDHVHSLLLLTNIITCLATLLLIPVAFSLFAPYSPIVVLGQTYLGKNVGFASGITLGLGSTIGGLVAPMVGWGADHWGVSAALQILWVAALLGAIFSFLIPKPKEL